MEKFWDEPMRSHTYDVAIVCGALFANELTLCRISDTIEIGKGLL